MTGEPFAVIEEPRPWVITGSGGGYAEADDHAGALLAARTLDAEYGVQGARHVIVYRGRPREEA